MNSLNEIPRTPQENEFYNYLLLSIYFYLKHNNYNLTAENLFNEGNLGSVFKFPQEVQEGTNENEILQKKFIQHFYYNSFFKSQDSFDLVSDFWNQFWEIFAIKIKQNNQTISPMDKYLLQEKGKLKLTYNQDTYHAHPNPGEGSLKNFNPSANGQENSQPK